MESIRDGRALPANRYAPSRAEFQPSHVLVRRGRVAAACCALLITVALPAFAADTAVYRCRDAERQVMYTDSPCPGGQ